MIKLFTTKEFIKNNREEVEFSDSFDFNKIFTSHTLLDKYLGDNGQLRRFSMIEFNYDLFKIINIENKLILKNKIPENHELYNRIMLKNSKSPDILKEQAAKFFTLAYFEGANPHWNKINDCNQYDINTIIVNEIIKGDSSIYQLFKEKLSKNYLESILHVYNPEDLSKSEVCLNLKETLITTIVKSNKFKLPNLLNNYQHSQELNIPIDYNKIKIHLDNIGTIKYHSLIALQDSNLNNLTFNISLLGKDKENISLLNLSKYIFMSKTIRNFIEDKKIYDLEGKNTDIKNSIYSFYKDSFLNTLVNDYISYKINTGNLNTKNKLTYLHLIINEL